MKINASKPFQIFESKRLFRCLFRVISTVLICLLLFAFNQTTKAAVTVTAPSLSISTGAFPSAYNALGNIIIDEGANNDFPIAARNTDYTFVITAPSNFEFQAGTGTVSAIASDITTVSVVVTATTITVTYRSSQANGTRQDQDDIITISGIQVRAITGVATQTATKTASSETIAGLTNGTVMANLSSSLGCNHTIRLTDTYGDGWDGGGMVTVTVNGTAVLTNITLASGSGPQDFTFAASTGDVINVTRTADGSSPSEMRVEVIGGSANTLLSTQQPATAPGTNIIACCAPTVPGLATYSSPANGAIGQNVCGVLLAWSAPANTGCNAATSYDVYFGTAASPPLVTNTTSTSYNTGTLSASTTYYWKIVPRNTSGTAVGAVTWSFTTSATPCTACNHIIRLTDSYGDGWSGGAVTVTVNGVPVLTNIALVGMSGPEDFTFAAADGAVINVTRTIDGSYPNELRVEILGASSTVILPIQNPVVAPGTNVSGCCSPTVPLCATSPTPAHGATGVNPCSADLSWTAPASSGCNTATSYDIYFGTTAVPPFLINTTATSYSLPFGMADNTVYYWKIVPKNGVGSAAGCTTWSFTTSASPNPAYCMYDDATNYPAGGSNCAQMTPESNSQSGCIWNKSKISFASAFDYTINMYFGNNVSGGDGCAFVFQNSPQGISACGNDGSQLGAGGISNSVIIEFDTYDNDSPWHTWDIAADHTAIEIDGSPDGPSAPFAGPVTADPLDGVLDDGAIYALRVTWNPATQLLSVYVNGNMRLSATYDFVTNVFGGNPNVWWGFTGSTGGLNNQQYFCPITIPVPVELLDYSVRCEENKAELTWFTASETNNLYFTIERSVDGVSFSPIATVLGAGNSNSTIMYRFVDEQATEGTRYYRISQTDVDGSVHAIGTKAVDCSNNSENLNIIAVANNAAAGHAVLFNTPITGNHLVQLFDLSGQLIESVSMNFDAGLNQIDLCSTPSSGVYLIKLSNSFDYKIIKVKF